MEKNPWWQNVQGPFPVWEGPKGVKPDGGGNIRGQGRVGDMKLHRAAHNRRKDGRQGWHGSAVGMLLGPGWWEHVPTSALAVVEHTEIVVCGGRLGHPP